MNTLGFCILSVLLLAVVFGSKRWALLGFAAGILYLTQAQHIEVAGFNLYAVRLIELAAFTRIMLRKEFSFSRLNTLDRLLLFLYLYTVTVFLLRSREEQAYQIGTAVDAMLSYFAIRSFVKDD